MRRLVAALALLVCVLGSASAAPQHQAGSAEGAAVQRSVAVTGAVLGISRQNGQGTAVAHCIATARGQVAILTQILSCTVTSSTGGATLKAVTPVTFPGSRATTVGVGALRYGFHTMCIKAHATYAAPAGSVTVYKCFPLVDGLP